MGGADDKRARCAQHDRVKPHGRQYARAHAAEAPFARKARLYHIHAEPRSLTRCLLVGTNLTIIGIGIPTMMANLFFCWVVGEAPSLILAGRSAISMPRAGSPAPARPRSASPAKGSKKKPTEKKSSKKKKKKEADESSEADDDIRLAGLGDTDGKQSSCFASQFARNLEPLTINLSHCADSYDRSQLHGACSTSRQKLILQQLVQAEKELTKPGGAMNVGPMPARKN